MARVNYASLENLYSFAGGPVTIAGAGNKRILRILHVVHQYFPEHVGGTELYTQQLARQQALSGHSPAVFAPAAASSHWPEAALDDGVRVYRAPVGDRSAGRVFRDTFGNEAIDSAISFVLEQEQPELAHIQHLKGVPAALGNRLVRAKIPFVVTLHDYWYACANAQLLTNYDSTPCQGPNWWLNCGRCALARAGHPGAAFLSPALAPLLALRNKRLYSFLGKAELLIAPTTFVRETYGGLGIPAGRIRVVPHGISTEGLSRRRGPSPGAFQVAYIGGLAWQKGVHVLIEAFNRLPAGEARLTIYGDEGAFPEYVAELRDIARHPGVSFAGRLDRSGLWPALAECDVVVVPSLWYETASLIVQESFAAGVPVIASSIGALTERVQAGVDGLLVPPGDVTALSTALEQLWRDPGMLAHLREGIRPVRTIEDHAHEIEELYGSAIRK
jgi:glycosyltransferase involved in cell wall biosynthesis